MERMTGFEPAALGLGSRCSTTELHPLALVAFPSSGPFPVTDGEGSVAEPTGFEPAISGLTGRRVNQATPRLRLQRVFYHPADPKSSRAAPVAAFSRRPLALGTESD